MQDYQFKHISHCLCIFDPEPFLFFALALDIIEWKGSCKEIFFVQLFLFCLNLITFRAPHLEEVLELMTLPKTEALIAKYHPLSKSFTSTIIWVTAAFFQAKQRVLGRALRKYIFVGTAWTDNFEDLMIHLLIWNSAVSG